jgi:hypothetical protein
MCINPRAPALVNPGATFIIPVLFRASSGLLPGFGPYSGLRALFHEYSHAKRGRAPFSGRHWHNIDTAPFGPVSSERGSLRAARAGLRRGRVRRAEREDGMSP